jgi:hypothetical protein
MIFKLRCPIHKKYINKRRVCMLTQLYGANKNRLFYGPKGHQGVDAKTQGTARWMWNKFAGYVRKKRVSEGREGGIIPIVAAHDGYLVSEYNDDHSEGIYVRLVSTCGNYKTTYFHLDKVGRYKGDRETGKDFVKAGTVLGWGGNSGKYTTGAHLHFSLRQKVTGGWALIDPMPFLQDEVVYQLYRGLAPSRWFYQGQEYNKKDINLVLKELYAKDKV